MRHPELLSWKGLSANPNPSAIKLLKQNPHRIYYDCLKQNTNPEAMEILKHHPEKNDWCASLSRNPAAIQLLDEKIKTEGGEYLDYVFMESLCENPNALHIIEKYPEHIKWGPLSRNPNPRAIRLLKENREKINWGELSKNPNQEAIELLEQNPHKICYPYLSMNPNALHLWTKYDYTKMKNCMKEFCGELTAKVFHPTRVTRIANHHGMEETEWLDIVS
jgi:hypothetical protein